MYLHCNTHKIIIIVLHNTRINMLYTQYTDSDSRERKRKSTIKRKEIEGKVVENWMLRFYYSQPLRLHTERHRYRHAEINMILLHNTKAILTQTHTQRERQDILICNVRDGKSNTTKAAMVQLMWKIY